MYVFSGVHRMRVLDLMWMRWQAILLLVLAAGLLPAVSQMANENGSSERQSPEQLKKTAESYENFLHQPPAPGTSPSQVAEVQAHLGAIYFLLHRYRDSLNVLGPVLREHPPLGHAAPDGTGTANTGSLESQSWLVSGLDHLELNELTAATVDLRHALIQQPASANARLALGDALARNGQMADAAKEYADQTRLTPSLPDAWYKLGLAHGQISADFSRSEVRPADKPIVQELAAEELLAKGDNLDAARVLFGLLHSPSTPPDVHADLGMALLALGYAQAAEDRFLQGEKTNPDSPLSRLGLAQTASLRGDWERVRSQLEYLTRSHPLELMRLLEFPPSGLVLQAWNGGQMKPFEDFAQSPAGALWKSWLSDLGVAAAFPTTEDKSRQTCADAGHKAWYEPGVWLSEECYTTLVRQFSLKKTPSVSMRAKLAEAEFRLGHYDAALRLAEILHRTDSLNGWGIYWLSKSHGAIAEECFLKVASLNPDSARVHQMLAEHYAKLSQYPKAKVEYLSAIRLASDLPELHLGLGTVLSRTGDLPQAEMELKTTLQLSPESDFAHYRLGHVYVQQSLWPQAIEQLRHVSVSSTALLGARLDLAKAESQTGQTAEAIQDLLSVAGLDRDGEVYFDLAAAYRKLGDQEHAHEALATFKKLRAASLQTNGEDLDALEKQQENGHADDSP